MPLLQLSLPPMMPLLLPLPMMPLLLPLLSTSTYILLKAAVIAAYYSLWSTAKGTGSAFGISLQRMKGMGFALLL